jgi:hypothetical protein
MKTKLTRRHQNKGISLVPGKGLQRSYEFLDSEGETLAGATAEMAVPL